VIGLGDDEFTDIDPKFFCIKAIEGVFRIDKSGDPSSLLAFGNGVEG